MELKAEPSDCPCLLTSIWVPIFRVHWVHLIFLGFWLCQPLNPLAVVPFTLYPSRSNLFDFTVVFLPSSQPCRLRPGRRVPSSATSPDSVGDHWLSHRQQTVPSQLLPRHHLLYDGTLLPRLPTTHHRTSPLSTLMRFHTSMPSPLTGGILMAPPDYFTS